MVRRYILKRVFLSLFVLWGVSVFVFLLVRSVPGDPATALLPPQASEAQVAAFREQLGLTKPLWKQYLMFIADILQGSFGQSIRYDQPALSLILERFQATLELTLASLVVAVGISIPAGVISAAYRDTVADYFATFFALFGVSMPNFWFGILLVLVLGVQFGLFPIFGYPELSSTEALMALASGRISPLITFLSYIALPAIALGTYMTAILTRTTRSNMLEQLGQEYVKVARSKGLPEYIVLTRHVLRNALLPTLTLLGLEFAKLLGGAVVIETVFAWPGVGRLIIDSIHGRDFIVVQAGIIFIATMFVFVNITIDVLYTVFDPRIEY